MLFVLIKLLVLNTYISKFSNIGYEIFCLRKKRGNNWGNQDPQGEGIGGARGEWSSQGVWIRSNSVLTWNGNVQDVASWVVTQWQTKWDLWGMVMLCAAPTELNEIRILKNTPNIVVFMWCVVLLLRAIRPHLGPFLFRCPLLYSSFASATYSKRTSFCATSLCGNISIKIILHMHFKKCMSLSQLFWYAFLHYWCCLHDLFKVTFITFCFRWMHIFFQVFFCGFFGLFIDFLWKIW